MFKKVASRTVAVWLGGTGLYAFYYVQSRLKLPGLVGYEAEWDWQLLFFGLVRLPWLLLVLAVVVWVEYKFIKK